MDGRKCPICGTESLVTVVSKGHDDGLLRQVCTECERRRLWEERSGVRQIARSTARQMTYAGVLLAVLTLTVDRLSIAGGTGFGWWQFTGTELGILSLLLGVIIGNGLLGVAGLFLLVMSLGADLLHLGRAPGLGWRKQSALAIASLLIAGSLLWEYVLKKSDADLPPPDRRKAPRP